MSRPLPTIPVVRAAAACWLVACSPAPEPAAPAAPASLASTASPTASSPAPTSAPPPPAPVDSVAVADSGRLPPAADCSGSLPPRDMVRDNIAATAISGIGEVVASTKLATDGKSPAPTSGYILFRYELRVVHWFSGKGADRLVLKQNAEAGNNPRPPGELLFFSACGGAGEAYEPDVGYVFSLDSSCRAEAEALGDAAAKKLASGGKRGRACDAKRK
jgi:hypothetical protein